MIASNSHFAIRDGTTFTGGGITAVKVIQRRGKPRAVE